MEELDVAAPLFEFYQEVIIHSEDPEYEEVFGQRGAIFGMSKDENGCFEYGVFVYRDQLVWSIPEDGIVATGVYHSRSDFYG